MERGLFVVHLPENSCNGSFSFKKDEINRLLHTAAQEKGLNDSLPNLMDKTSLGNGKVGRVKNWAVRAGLIKNNRPSPEGEIVRLSDYLSTGDIWQSDYPFLEATGRNSQIRKTFVDTVTPATSTH